MVGGQKRCDVHHDKPGRGSLLTRLSGFFGGTFDPIHFGHLRTALELRNYLGLDEVRFTPCGCPPHGKTPVASAAIRLDMLRAAINGQPDFVVDERELNRVGPSYTVETLESLRAESATRPIGLILGMDAFIDIGSWHRSEDILRLAHVIVARRPGAQLPGSGHAGTLLAANGVTECAELTAIPAGKIFVHTVTQLEISSSAIRAAAGAGQSQRYLVPDAVATLIETTGCYAP
ncbi:MAG: nicotinate-nucleotide adenylyltransferase [Gammaproteobacteria bacterium]|jgi:nicotinate-nucleotide adenylyltransferase|nr:nicotinic acid mononucleotide adenylyltransferase [Chromatiales bacterium]MCP4926591.1 nicotinate-nucleotide adenylyltransferase [Gammaproteobacteria bacterium]MDP7153192.1 nicotinate-nucleotide adenylyltransferase [Gammaproteobacteria bacterium]MDP7296097.1 nicotinate-nucleotide adenylyltransferase [Gammaproteobacteria bacterium]